MDEYGLTSGGNVGSLATQWFHDLANDGGPGTAAYRLRLEAAMEQSPPLVELTIQSSATLQKGSKVLIDALGLASHPS